MAKRKKNTGKTDTSSATVGCEAQLHAYALGYQELTGRRPDYVEIYELDQPKRKPRSVDDELIEDVKVRTRRAAEALRSGQVDAAPTPRKWGSCDHRRMCRAGRAVAGVR